MGNIWCADLADVLRRAALTVVEVEGWQTRSRGSGGFDSLIGATVHHTAGATGARSEDEVAYMLSASNENSPTANLYVARDGAWWVMAAGATNTAGKGGPAVGVSLHNANRHLMGIEAGNDGVGEPWPAVQTDSYIRGVATLTKRYGWPLASVISHWEWVKPHDPTRKKDPAGPSPFAPPAVDPRAGAPTPSSWNMNAFRAAVASEIAARGDIQSTEVQDMAIIIQLQGDAPGVFWISNGLEKRWCSQTPAALKGAQAFQRLCGGDVNPHTVSAADFPGFGPVSSTPSSMPPVPPGFTSRDAWGRPRN